jgi:hypothetical protein
MLSFLGARPRDLVKIEPNDQDWYSNLLWLDGRKCLNTGHPDDRYTAMVSEMQPRVQRLTVLGLLRFLADRLEAEQNGEALRSINYLGGIAEDENLDDEACILALQRGLTALGRSPLFDAPLLWREDFDQRVIELAPLEAALKKIGQVLIPPRPEGGSVFGKVKRG